MAGYRELTPEAFAHYNQRSQERKTGNYPDRYTLKVAVAGQPPARNRFRVMPPHENMIDAEGRPDVFVEVKVHFSLGPANDKAVNCGEPFGMACAACTYVDKLFKLAKAEENPVTRKQQEDFARRKAAKLRFAANVVDMEHPEKGVLSFWFGTDLEKKLRQPFWDDDMQFRDITHPVTGRDVFISAVKKQGTDFNDYPEVRAAEQASPLRDMDWLDGINDLTEQCKAPSEQDIADSLAGRQRGEASKPVAVATSAAPAPAAGASAAVAPVQAPAPARQPKPPVTTGKKPGTPIAAPAAVTPAPPAAASPATAPAPSRRAAATEEPADPWAAQWVFLASYPKPELGWKLIAPEDVDGAKKPVCYKDCEPTDPQCMICKVVLPCLKEKMAATAAA